MADYYVKAGAGNTNPFSSWAGAAAVISSISAIDAPGDRVFVSVSHTETVASSSNAWAGTAAAPVLIASVLDGAAPPSGVSAGATITVTGTTFAWSGFAYTKGLTFVFTSASSYSPMFNGSGASAVQLFEDCNFFYTGVSSSSAIAFGTTAAGAGSETRLRNPWFRLASAGQFIQPGRSLQIQGGGFAAGGASPNGVFQLGANNRPSILTVDGFDLSALAAAVNLVATIQEGSSFAVFRNIKLPPAWTGNLVTPGQMKPGTRVEMWNGDSAGTNYRLWIEAGQGSIKHSTAVYRSGATGGTPHSVVMSTNANAAYPSCALEGPGFILGDAVVGSPTTLTVEVATDGVTLTDADCWLELMYMGSADSPLGAWASNIKVDLLAAAAPHPASAEAWVTAGLASPVRQKLSVTFTAQMAGYVVGRVCLAKPSTTVYVDMS